MSAVAAVAVGGIGLAACSSAVHTAGQTSAPASSTAPARSAQSSPGSPKSAAAASASVTIAAVGDTMLGNTPDLPPDPATYLDAVKPELDSGAQIVFGNLEGTLTTASGSKCGSSNGGDCFAFHDPPDYIGYLKGAGFTVLNDANNHSMDFGSAGLSQTVQTIHSAGLAQTGLPGEITLVTANGVRVAFVAFAPYNWTASLLDLPAAEALIKKATTEAPVVVAYMHAGGEGSDADHVTGQEETYVGEDRGNPEAFAHLAIDSGASLVLASGPHVLRGMQFYHGHLIAYSLGNFAGYSNFGTDGDLDLSTILHVTLSGTGQFKQAQLYPIELNSEDQPSPGGDSTSFIAQLSQQDFGSTAAHFSSSGVVQAP